LLAETPKEQSHQVPASKCLLATETISGLVSVARIDPWMGWSLDGPSFSGRGGPWSCEGLMPQCGGCWSGGVGKDGWVGEHPHGGKEEGGKGRCGMRLCGGITGKWDIT